MTAELPVGPIIAAVSDSNVTHQRAIVRRLAALLDRGDARLGLERIAAGPSRGAARAGLQRPAPTMCGNRPSSLAAHLRAAGARVVGTDPRAESKARRADPDLEIADSVADAVSGADAVLVATEWREYETTDWVDLAARMGGDLVYDARNVLAGDDVRKAGLRYVSLGRV
jgi:UDP-glucose 6-dehydrogenase